MCWARRPGAPHPAGARPGLCQTPGLALPSTSAPPGLLGHPPPRSPVQAYWRLRRCEGGNATAFLGPWGAGWARNWGSLWAGACKERASHSHSQGRGLVAGSQAWEVLPSALAGPRQGNPAEEGGVGGRGGRRRQGQEQAESLLSVGGDHPWRTTHGSLGDSSSPTAPLRHSGGGERRRSTVGCGRLSLKVEGWGRWGGWRNQKGGGTST